MPSPAFPVDWSQPWYAAIHERGQAVAQADDWRAALNAAAFEQRLCNHRGLPLSFVPQQALPLGTAYEAFISASGQVPTRDNLHDFFNALTWLAFPQIKAQLNALQAAEIQRSAIASGPASTRGAARDAATLFDENAALVVLRDDAAGREMAQALREHQWSQAFLERREVFGSTCRIVLFGHALLEKLVSPYKAITAHAWLLTADEDFFAMSAVEQKRWLDAAVAQQLTEDLNPSTFTPLPVLGIPGWVQCQDQAFYADAGVFRPKRNRLLKA